MRTWEENNTGNDECISGRSIRYIDDGARGEGVTSCWKFVSSHYERKKGDSGAG